MGWVSAQVALLEPRPLRCFRCREAGHTGACCTSGVDRSRECFRCGKEGHKAAVCSADPRCSLCAAAGKPAEHITGSQWCKAPGNNKGRRAVNLSQTARPAVGTTRAEEGAMDIAE